MKKSKIVLLFSAFVLLFIFRFNFEVNYDKDGFSGYISGVIDTIQDKGDYVSFVLKGKDKYLVNYAGDLSYSLGSKVKVYGEAYVPQDSTCFYLFNYKNYLLSKGIKYVFKAERIQSVSSKVDFKYKIKNGLENYINSFKSSSFIKALVMGDNDIDDDIMESYRNNGISHLFAISGTHITILTSVLFFIFDKFFKNKDISFLIICLFLGFYVFLTGYSLSVVRASLLFIIINFNKVFEIKIKSIYILLILFCLFLIFNPFYIFNIGFLLSFVISFFLLLSKSSFLNVKGYLGRSFYVSLISFFASYPIIINSYFEINFISPILNLFFGPLICLFIYPLCLLCLVFKPLDILLYKFISIFNFLSLEVSKYDYFKFSFSHMNILFIIVFYLLLLMFIYKGKKCLYLIFVFFVIHYNVNYLDFTSSFTMIDVGQGDSFLIKLSHNRGNILVDTGGQFDKDGTSNISDRKVIPFLKAMGVKKIQFLVLSHGDFDHMGEAVNLVNNFKVEKIIFNCGEYNDLEKDLIKVLDKKKIKYYSCIKELNIDNSKLYFLQTKEYDNENDNSNVIYMEINNYKFMFMGDASTTTEKEILNKYNLPDIDVLKVGHHGSKTSSGKEFINEINPKYSIISVGKNNRYGHPNKEVLNNLKNSNVYRTDEDGSIMFKIKNNKLKVETCSP